ncbi:MAG: hypothetical protein V4469_03220 [Patescibacteria group bacterium]
MKKDLQNVIITFWLIAFVFASGSLAYQKKKEKQYEVAIEQSKLETKQIKNLIAENKTQTQFEKDQLAMQEKIRADQIAKEQLAIKNAQNKKALDQALAAQAAAEYARQQALILAAQKTKAQVVVPAPTPIQMPVVVIKTSRRSRAS